MDADRARGAGRRPRATSLGVVVLAGVVVALLVDRRPERALDRRDETTTRPMATTPSAHGRRPSGAGSRRADLVREPGDAPATLARDARGTVAIAIEWDDDDDDRHRDYAVACVGVLSNVDEGDLDRALVTLDERGDLAADMRSRLLALGFVEEEVPGTIELPAEPGTVVVAAWAPGAFVERTEPIEVVAGARTAVTVALVPLDERGRIIVEVVEDDGGPPRLADEALVVVCDDDDARVEGEEGGLFLGEPGRESIRRIAPGVFVGRLAAGRWSVHAVAEDAPKDVWPRAPRVTSPVEVVIGATATSKIRLVLPSRATADIRVVDVDGAPVAGAPVKMSRDPWLVSDATAATPREHGDAETLGATGNDGRLVARVAPGDVLLWAASPRGVGSPMRQLLEPGVTSEVALVVADRPPLGKAMLRATVTRRPDAVPARGLPLWCTVIDADDDLDASLPVDTDDAGVFVVGLLEPGAARVIIEPRDRRASGDFVSWRANVDLLDGRVTDVAVALEQGALVVARLVAPPKDDPAMPDPEATSAQATPVGAEEPCFTAWSSDGRIGVRLPSGSWDVRFSVSDGIDRAMRVDVVEADIGSTIDLGDIALSRGASVAGQVTDERGDPLAVRVEVKADDGKRRFDHGSDRYASDSTSEDGRFRVQGLAAGRYRVCASHEQFDPIDAVDPVFVDVPDESSHVDGVRLVVPRDAVATDAFDVTGLVTTDDGRPLAGVDVTGFGADYDRGTTDGEGRFALRFRVARTRSHEVALASFVPAKGMAIVTARGDPDRDVDVVLVLREPCRIRGRLTLPDGMSRDDIHLELARGAADGPLRDVGLSPLPDPILDRAASPDGSIAFEFPAVPEGPWTLRCIAWGTDAEVARVDVSVRAGRETRDVVLGGR